MTTPHDRTIGGWSFGSGRWRSADVVQRAEHPRGDQAVAPAPQHPGPASAAPGELGDHRRLAEAGLTEHDRDAPTGAGEGQEVVGPAP